MAVEKPGNLGNFFSYFVATLWTYALLWRVSVFVCAVYRQYFLRQTWRLCVTDESTTLYSTPAKWRETCMRRPTVGSVVELSTNTMLSSV